MYYSTSYKDKYYINMTEHVKVESNTQSLSNS